jgi:antirestriction protein ArdC
MTTTAKAVETVTFKDTYQEVTDAVIKALEEGTVIWQCSWSNAGFPKNATTNIHYRGWNIFWLNFHSMINNYPSSAYLTFKQAHQLGGMIKKGEKGIRIVYWATIELKKDNADQSVQNTDDATPKTKMVPKAYTVFNIAQTEGIEFPEIETFTKTKKETIKACEALIKNMPEPPAIKNGDSPYYTIASDTVTIPKLKAFSSSEEYYSTLFHELAHSTGHESRLNRKELMQSDGFGSASYAKEELTAELTAALLSAITGINIPTFDNSAAYIKGWLKALKNDKTLVIKAATQAQRAAVYIRQVTYETV